METQKTVAFPADDSMKKSDKIENHDKCAICLMTMEEGEANGLKTLKCGHKFHAECIKSWFAISQKERCPICRAGPSGAVEDETVTMDSNIIFEPDFAEDFDFSTDTLFGSFTTESGDSVFIYESPVGIIMIRTMNITVPLPTPPIGTTYVSLPQPLTTRYVPAAMRRRGRHRMRHMLTRFGNKITNAFQRLYFRVRTLLI